MATQVESPLLAEKTDRPSSADEGEIPVQIVTSETSVPAVEESRAERTSAEGEGSRSEGTTEGQSGEAEEEEECGFCLFMKAGPCGQRFSLWQDCVESAEKSEKDIVEECAQLTTLLKVCMEMNPQYYGPILDAEKAMEREVNSAEAGAGSQASPAAGSETSENAEVPVEGGGESQSESEQPVVNATEVLSVVLDDEGEVLEVINEVRFTVPQKPATETSME